MQRFKGTFSKSSLVGPAVKIASEGMERRARLGLPSSKRKYTYSDTAIHSLDSFYGNVAADMKIGSKAPILYHGMNAIILRSKKYRLISTTSDEFREFIKKVDAEKDPTKLEGLIIGFFGITAAEDKKFVKELLASVKTRLGQQKELKEFTEGAKAIAIRKGKLYRRKKPVTFIGILIRKVLGIEVYNMEK